MSVPVDLRLSALSDIIMNHKLTIDVAQAADIKTLVSQLTMTDWNSVLSVIGSTYENQLLPLLETKTEMEYFLGVSLVTKPGLTFPGVIIPIIAGATTFLQTYALNKNSEAQTGTSADPTMQSMKMMNYFMPIMMGVMTVSLPAGLGVYWAVSNLFQALQTIIVSKALRKKDAKLGEERK